MRIVLLCRVFESPRRSNTREHFRRIAEELASAGTNLHIICEARHDALPWYAPNGTQVSIHRVPYGAEWYHDKPTALAAEAMAVEEIRGLFLNAHAALGFGLAIQETLRRLEHDAPIDFIEAPDTEAPLYFEILRRMTKYPAQSPTMIVAHACVASQLRDLADEDAVWPPHRRSLHRHEHFVLHGAHAVVTQSQAHADELRAMLRSDNIRFVVQPATATNIRESSSTATHASPQTILFPQNLDIRNGSLEFLEVLRLLPQQAVPLHVKLVGSDASSPSHRLDSVAAYIASELRYRQDIVLLHRPVNNTADLKQEAAAAHCVVFCPRTTEVPADLRTCVDIGARIVASPTGGIAECFTSAANVSLASTDTPKELADTLHHVLHAAATPSASGRNTAPQSRAHVADPFAWRNALRDEFFPSQPALPVEPPTANRIPLPAGLPFQNRTVPRRRATATTASGVAVIIPCYNLGAYLEQTLRSVTAQSYPPAAIVVVDDGSTDTETLSALDRVQAMGIEVLRQSNAGVVAARKNGFARAREIAMAKNNADLLAVCFLDADDLLRPDFLREAADLLANCAEVGLASCYVRHVGAAQRYWCEPPPSFPCQWLMNGAATCSVYRLEAYEDAGGYQPVRNGCYSDWDLNNAVLANGWVGITIPRVLAEYRVRTDSMMRSARVAHHVNDLRVLLDRFSGLVAEDAVELVLMAESESYALRSHVHRLKGLLRSPRQLVSEIIRKVRRRKRRY